MMINEYNSEALDRLVQIVVDSNAPQSTKRGRGRPRVLNEAKSYSVTLDANTRLLMQKLGEGNTSAGARALIDHFVEEGWLPEHFSRNKHYERVDRKTKGAADPMRMFMLFLTKAQHDYIKSVHPALTVSACLRVLADNYHA